MAAADHVPTVGLEREGTEGVVDPSAGKWESQLQAAPAPAAAPTHTCRLLLPTRCVPPGRGRPPAGLSGLGGGCTILGGL